MPTGTLSKPVDLDITMFPKQRNFVMDTAPFKAAVTGVGGGKSRAGAIDDLLYLSRNPHSLSMVTAPTYKMLNDATLRSVFEVFPEGWYEFGKADMQLKFRNGAEILFRSTEDAERLRGPNLARFRMDEAALSPEAAFLILQGRLRQPGFLQQGIVTTTPKGFNWVYRTFAQTKREAYSLHHWRTQDNIFLPKNFIASLRGSYDETFQAQELGGEFILLSGGYFQTQALQEMLADCVEPRRTERGVLKIWRNPAPTGRYIIGADCAWGFKGAYDCAVVGTYGFEGVEQVAEVYGRLGDGEMARELVDAHRMYNHAYIGVENNGEGKNVANLVRDLLKDCTCQGEESMYFQDGDKREKPGWYTGGGTRDVQLRVLEEAVRNGRLKLRCKDAVQEFMSFIRRDDGKGGPADGAYADHVMASSVLFGVQPSAKFGGGVSAVAAEGSW